MPTYHARNITVRLGSVPLAETITSDIALRKGEKAKRQSELAENKLLHSRFLQEKRLQFPGVTDDFELNWLGNAPFMQVVADNGTALPSELTGNAPQDRVAQALALHVELSDKAFHSGFVGKTHLKIEVFFNGQLSACSLTHSNDIRSGAKPLHQVFAGYRIDFLAERPWVLLPSFMTADGGTRRFHKTITPFERFSEISAALRKEAAERGTDKQGAPPPSARFIDALARMQAPASVANLQKPGGKKFGVVDVIITAGTGNKLTTGTNYLKRPQKLKDFDYAVRTEIESELDDNSHSARARVDEVRSTMDRFHRDLRSQSNNACPETEDNVDLLDESPCKRQALSLAEGSSQHAAQKIDFQIPSLGAKQEATLQYHVSSTAGGFSQRGTTKYRADRCKKPLPCSDGDHTYRIAHDLPQMMGFVDTAARGLHRFQSSPAVSYSSTPQSLLVPPILAGMPSSDSVTEVRTPNASYPPSKTLDVANDHKEGNLSFSKPIWCGGDDPSTLVDPYIAPTEWMLPVATSWQSSPIPMGSPHFHPGYVPQPATSKTYTPSGHPNGLPILGPQARFFYSQPGHTPPMLPTSLLSPVIQRNGPLPPTAMFSVPSKPRSNASPRKNLAVTEYAGPSTDVLVKRLVITDLDGKSIIDHHWSTPQYIVGNRCTPTGGTRIAISTVHSRDGKDIKDARTDTNRQSILEQRRDSLQDSQVGSLAKLPLPYLKRHQGPFDNSVVANSQIDVPDNIAPFVSIPMLTATPQTKCSHSIQAAAPSLPTASTVLPRRVLQRHAVPSIQGPKAATFLYDDPEDVLREAARIRRSKSSKERPANVPTSSSALPAQPSVTSDRDRQGGSSPLSSAPSSPLLNPITEAVETVSLPPGHTSQLDGCFETALPTTPLQNQSPCKLTTSKPRLQRPTPVTPQSSVSPGSKKRKWPVKVPRSPDRLMTVRNPPLNDDCVIAFAESADKNEKRGILRQVRGERQGVFKEEYVMLAVRFYIAGS